MAAIFLSHVGTGYKHSLHRISVQNSGQPAKNVNGVEARESLLNLTKRLVRSVD